MRRAERTNMGCIAIDLNAVPFAQIAILLFLVKVAALLILMIDCACGNAGNGMKAHGLSLVPQHLRQLGNIPRDFAPNHL